MCTPCIFLYWGVTVHYNGLNLKRHCGQLRITVNRIITSLWKIIIYPVMSARLGGIDVDKSMSIRPLLHHNTSWDKSLCGFKSNLVMLSVLPCTQPWAAVSPFWGQTSSTNNEMGIGCNSNSRMEGASEPHRTDWDWMESSGMLGAWSAVPQQPIQS